MITNTYYITSRSYQRNVKIIQLLSVALELESLKEMSSQTVEYDYTISENTVTAQQPPTCLAFMTITYTC